MQMSQNDRRKPEWCSGFFRDEVSGKSQLDPLRLIVGALANQRFASAPTAGSCTPGFILPVLRIPAAAGETR